MHNNTTFVTRYRRDTATRQGAFRTSYLDTGPKALFELDPEDCDCTTEYVQSRRLHWFPDTCFCLDRQAAVFRGKHVEMMEQKCR